MGFIGKMPFDLQFCPFGMHRKLERTKGKTKEGKEIHYIHPKTKQDA
jgi:hypothetical protein